MDSRDEEWLALLGISRLDPDLCIESFINETAPDPFRSEFYYTDTFSPDLIAGYFYSGILPMAIMTPSGDTVLTPKLHTYRCVLDFKDLHIEKRIKKKTRGLTLGIGRSIHEVMGGCLARHGSSWLYPPLVRAFLQISDEGDIYPVKIISVELRDRGKLIAGEIGCTAGRCYTSLSGFHTADSSGTIQLAALGRLLEKINFAFWDLGMYMPYKERLGASEIPAEEFIARFRMERTETPDGFPAEPVSVDELLNC
jgi:leucyl/phenylalanyl-tRNA--protein transferase